MMTTVAQLAGGIGLFLLGMIIMTNGLKALAGPVLKRWLARFTKSPSTGAATGAVTTAIIQSSSATTVTAIGFVSAGLLTFPQALGIIFGANLGTTITGWIVALVGFKLNLGVLVLPLILVGVLLRLFGSARPASVGMALAGFGLIFVGIDGLQEAMSGVPDLVTPESFPPDTWGGRALLVGLGILVTLITQSSSAGMAIALVALHAGTVSFGQAAALVIGMDVGTTATAALATIGASTQARRTGFAHVIYNCLTACGAFLILPAFIAALGAFSGGALPGAEAELSLVGFHTFFNGLGVVLVLPFTNQFAALLERIVPEEGAPLTRGLDPVLLQQPDVALVASAHALEREATRALQEFEALLERDADAERSAARREALETALAETRLYIAQIRVPAGDPRGGARLVSMYHLIDHLLRLLERCNDDVAATAASVTERLAAPRAALRTAVADTYGWLRDPSQPAPEPALAAIWQGLSDQREPLRREVLGAFASGALRTPESLLELDAARWLERCTYHAWRVAHHLQRILDPVGGPDEELPPHREPLGPLP